jgi:hypothetical protein
MLALCALASTYVTYVVTRSSFPLVENLRVKVFERWGEGSWQGYLATCSWCAGFWLAGLVTLTTWVAVDDLPVPVLVWLASAAVTGVLLETVDTLVHARTRRVSGAE